MIERSKRKKRREKRSYYNPYNQYTGCIIPHWLLIRKEVSPPAKLIWVQMVNHGREGFCFPSQQQLSEECGLSKSTVKRGLKELIDLKLIRVENPRGADRLKHFNNVYFFLTHEFSQLELPNLTPSKVQPEPPNSIKMSLPSKYYHNNELLRNSKLLRNLELLRNPVDTSYEVSTKNAASTDASVLIIRKKRNKKRKDFNSLSDEVEEMQRNDIKTMRGKKIKKGLKKLRSKVVMPESIKSIIEHWNSLPLRKMKYNTLKHQRTVDLLKKLLRGKFFTGEIENGRIKKYANVKFTCKDLIKSIDNFALVVDNSFYTPNANIRKFYKKMSLETFIYYDGSFNNSKPHSTFLKFLEETPKPKSAPVDPIPDKHPQLSLRLKNLYVQNVLGGMNGNLSDRDLNCFKYGAERLHKFWMSNRRYISSLLRGENELCDLLYKSLETTTGGKMQKITPVKFCSDFTFNHVLPTYLVDQGMESSSLVRMN